MRGRTLLTACVAAILWTIPAVGQAMQNSVRFLEAQVEDTTDDYDTGYTLIELDDGSEWATNDYVGYLGFYEDAVVVLADGGAGVMLVNGNRYNVVQIEDGFAYARSGTLTTVTDVASDGMVFRTAEGLAYSTYDGAWGLLGVQVLISGGEMYDLSSGRKLLIMLEW